MCLLLLQLFDKDNYLNKHPSKYLFTTEGHILPISREFRHKAWEDHDNLYFHNTKQNSEDNKPEVLETLIVSNATEDVSNHQKHLS